ncbi:hypothetical protein [Lonepinella sp. BR2357]|uniref:hypothetical protein n=1 Tax=Lonepinella sp. BR2357 TaxID=3434549 RepID=UPI003F6DF4AF
MAKIEENVNNLDLFPDMPIPKKVGRPKKYANQADKQRAYRERLKAQGKKQISRIVKDVSIEPLNSDLIDLTTDFSTLLNK